MGKLVSVVIPTYNRSELLTRAIKSVRAQTYKNLEILVVDNGSIDNTEEIVKGISDKRVKYYKMENLGANPARNLGIKNSNGDFIAFLDDDDEWLPEKIEKQLKAFSENDNIGLVYTGTNIVYVNENLTYLNLPKDSGDLSKKILFINLIGTTSSVILKKKVIEKSGYFDNGLSARQDYDYWIRICQNFEVGCVKEALLNYYNYRDVKQISSNTKSYELSIEKIEKKHFDLFKSLSEEETKKRKENDFFSLANKAIRNNDSKLCRNYLKMISFSKKKIIVYILSYFSYKKSLQLRKYLNK